MADTLLKKLRERSGLTVQEAAEKIGVHRATLYTWEDDPPGRRAGAEALRSLLDLYRASQDERVSVALLFALNEAPQPAEAA